MVYLNRILNEPTPQSEPLEGMVPNSAGGHAYPVDDMTRLRRFLILGSEGGSYYADERKLTLENAAAVKRCIENDGTKAVYEIAYMSRHGRAPKVGPPLFALAMAATYGNPGTRELAFGYLHQMARTGSQLHQFAEFIDSMRGWGRGLRRAISNWYISRDLQPLVYQAVKYRSRYNWTHRDLLRKVHAKASATDTLRNELLAWVTHGTMPSDVPEFSLIHAYEQAKTADAKTLAGLIRQYRMSWEMVPSEMMDKKEIWEALAEDMPMTALVRNLATLTRLEVIAPMKTGWVCDRLLAIGNTTSDGEDGEDGEGSVAGGDGGAGGRGPRLHPIAILSALLTYRAGKGVRGQNTWTPVPQVVDALDPAFDRSFDTAPQTNQRYYLGIDVSGSMSWGNVAGVPGLTPRMAAAAMAMVIARREPNYYMAGFSSYRQPMAGFSSYRQAPITWNSDTVMAPLSITARDSITDAMQKTQALDFGKTDCALPMLDARHKNIPVDCFIILTDSETWAGKVHPTEALRQYRQATGINAKLVVVGMVANNFTIADPEDAGMMDVVGFDSAAPQLFADFAMSGGSGPAVVEPEDVPAENTGSTDDF